MSDYVKGEKPRDLDAAKGGPTLERVRDWQKAPDVGMLGPPNKQAYDKKGGKGDGDERREGDTKSLKAIKPRK